MTGLPNTDEDTGAELDIVAMLERQAGLRPDHVFVRTASARTTYAELRAASARLAGSLAELGVGPGTGVAVIMKNSVDQVVVWFALARLGALHAPVNTALVGPRLQHVLAVSGCTFAVVDEDLVDRLNDLRGGAPDATSVEGRPVRVSTVIVHGTKNATARHPRLAEMIASGCEVTPAVGDPMDPATLLFTSGTTGVSKACVLSRRYLAAQGAAHARNFELTSDDVLYCPFPLFHIDAATLTVVAALSVGGTAALSPRFSASRFWEEVRAFDASVFNFMGATLTILWKQPPSDRDQDHRVRLAWGVPMPEWQHEWTRRFGIPLLQVYGSTDAGVPVYDPVDGSQRPGRAGKVTTWYDVRIDAEHGQGSGEILVRGHHPGLTMSGYHAMPDATADTIDADGWVHTGDLGALDADGFLTFLGRSSDSIRRRGENVSAFEVEELVVSHPDVVEAAAVGVPSELTEEDVMVFVVPRAGVTLDERGLHDYVSARAPRFMVPRYYQQVSSLPKTPTQKIEKFQLREAGLSPDTFDAER